MDLVNELSNDLAVALLVEGGIARKLDGLDAKTFIARVEEALSRISDERLTTEAAPATLAMPIDLSH